MKEKDWQLMWYFLLWLRLPFMIALSFYGNFRRWEKICKNTCYKFFAIISFALLPSSRFILDVWFRLFCQTPIIEMPSLNRNERDSCANCGTQTTKLNLPVTRRDVQFEQCIVPNNPFSPRNPGMIWITILLRSVAPQNLMLPLSVNFVIKSFHGFTLYVNKKTLNTECRSDQEQEMYMWNI